MDITRPTLADIVQSIRELTDKGQRRQGTPSADTTSPTLAQILQATCELMDEERNRQRPRSPDTTSPTLSKLVQARELMDEAEAADYLDVSPGTLSVWRSTGRYNLPFIKVGRRVKYHRVALDAWLATRTRSSGATA